MNELLTRASLPSAANAKLPINYEKAKDALERCATVDECKEWKVKAEAIASYAKQSEDETLFKLATKIRARAIRRCGEIFATIPEAPRGGERPGAGRPRNSIGLPPAQLNPPREILENSATHSPQLAMSERQRVARAAGLSQAQTKQAMLVQQSYSIERENETMRIPTEQATNAELLSKATELRAHAAGCLKHADELERFVEQRQIAAE